MDEINSNRITFYKFLNEDISKESLENWINENKYLEKLFQKDHYIDLLSFNYKSNETKNYIKSIVKIINSNWTVFISSKYFNSYDRSLFNLLLMYRNKFAHNEKLLLEDLFIISSCLTKLIKSLSKVENNDKSNIL